MLQCLAVNMVDNNASYHPSLSGLQIECIVMSGVHPLPFC